MRSAVTVRLLDAFHGRFGSNAHSFVDFFLRCFFLEGNHKIGQRNIRSRDADTHAVQFTGKFRKDKTRSLGCTSREPIPSISYR